jgi:hypothetical protein
MSRTALSRAKGWRLPPGAVRLDRHDLFASPFRPPRRRGDLARIVGMDGAELACERPSNPAEAVAAYRAWIEGRWPTLAALLEMDEARLIAHLGAPPSIEEVAGLRGRALACWCPEAAPCLCHGTVLLELARGPRCEPGPAKAA